MGFPLLQKSGEMCPDRQIVVPGKLWNFNRGHMCEDEVNPFFKCTVLTQSLKLEHRRNESVEIDTVSDEIRRWSSLSEDECQRFVTAEYGVLNEFEMMCQLRILCPFHFVVFK